MRKSGVILAAMLLLCAACVGAASIIQTTTLPFEDANWGYFVDFDQFDPDLGTLDSISLMLTGVASRSVGLENLNPTPESAIIQHAMAVNLYLPDMSVLASAQFPAREHQFGGSAYDGDLDYDGPSGTNFICGSEALAESTINLSPQYNLLFTGEDSILLPCYANAAAVTWFMGDWSFCVRAVGTASVTLTYDYTPVPEPSSLLALGSGLAGLLAFRRRRS